MNIKRTKIECFDLLFLRQRDITIAYAFGELTTFWRDRKSFVFVVRK